MGKVSADRILYYLERVTPRGKDEERDLIHLIQSLRALVPQKEKKTA